MKDEFNRKLSDAELNAVTGGRKAGEGQKDFMTTGGAGGGGVSGSGGGGGGSAGGVSGVGRLS